MHIDQVLSNGAVEAAEQWRLFGNARHWCICQDYGVLPKTIMNLWQSHKMSHRATQAQLVLSRARGVEGLVNMVQFVEAAEISKEYDDDVEVIRKSLTGKLCKFIQHDVVQQWQLQFEKENYGKLHRFQMLLIRGDSQAGKSMFAKSLFGVEHTLVVNCQLGTNAIPSLRHFNRRIHRAIILDEVTVEQILGNKALVQSTVEKVQLAQSQCGAHRYEIWAYGIAWILCANHFPLEQVPKKVSEEDAEWLCKNITHVELPSGSKWYIDAQP
jgi:hypothetical protein